MTAGQVKNLDKPMPMRRDSKSDKIVNIVFKMMLDGYSNIAILRYLKSHTNASYNVIRHCIEAVSYNNFTSKEKTGKLSYTRRSDGSIAVARSAIFKYSLSLSSRTNDLKSKDAKDGKIGWWLKIIEKEYQIVFLIRRIASEFYSIITGTEPDKIEEFIERYGSVKDKDRNFKKANEQKIIEGFCQGLKNDLEAVKNSIMNKDVSSGPVEGCNNKFKLVKRKSYGRTGLENLAQKCILAFSRKIKGFSVKALVSTGKSTNFVMHYKRRRHRL